MTDRARLRLERLLWVAAVVTAAMAVQVNAAASTTVETATERSSCVMALEGWNDASPTLSWSNGSTSYRMFRLKCYYQSGARTGTAGYYPSGWSLPAGPGFSNCIYIARDSSTLTLMYNSTWTGGTTFEWSTFNVVETGDRYFEISMQLRFRTGSPNPSSWDRTLARVLWDPNCSGGGSDAYEVGDRSGDSPSRSEWVGYDVFDSEVPLYRWGPAVSVPFCGAEVEFERGGVVLEGDDIVKHGDVFDVATTWTSGRTEQVEIVWPWGGPRTGIFSAGAISNPLHVDVTVSMPVDWRNRLVRADQIKLRCLDTLVGVTLELPYGQPYDDAGDGRSRPCDLIDFYWPEQQDVETGDVLEWSYVYSGLVPVDASFTTLDLEWAVFDDQAEAPTPEYASLSWTLEVNDAALGAHGTAEATAGYDGTTRQFLWRCTDYQGTKYGNQFANSRQVGGVPPSSEADCLAEGGIGWNPKSWVPGLVKMTSCVLQQLFVPDQESLDDVNDTIDEINEKAPIAYVTETSGMIVGVMDGAPASVTSHRDDCLNVLPGGLVDGIGDQMLCPSTVASGSLTTARTIVGALFYVGAAWVLFQMTRRLIAQ